MEIFNPPGSPYPPRGNRITEATIVQIIYTRFLHPWDPLRKWYFTEAHKHGVFRVKNNVQKRSEPKDTSRNDPKFISVGKKLRGAFSLYT